MSTATDIKLLAEGTGPRISTLAVIVPQPVNSSGASVADRTVNQQVITLALSSGDLWVDLQGQILAELRQVRELLTSISAQLD
jgi:hypothetical protein